MRQGGEAVLLLLQRARWDDASGRLLAAWNLRETIDLGMDIGAVVLVANMSRPLSVRQGRQGKGRDLFLLLTTSRHRKSTAQAAASCPAPGDGVKDQHGPQALLECLRKW
jgi:Lhr-like helicase